jgi:hypothetical protein
MDCPTCGARLFWGKPCGHCEPSASKIIGRHIRPKDDRAFEKLIPVVEPKPTREVTYDGHTFIVQFDGT